MKQKVADLAVDIMDEHMAARDQFAEAHASGDLEAQEAALDLMKEQGVRYRGLISSDKTSRKLDEAHCSFRHDYSEARLMFLCQRVDELQRQFEILFQFSK